MLNQRLRRNFVNKFVVFFLVKNVIKAKLSVVEIFCNTTYFLAGLVDNAQRVQPGNSIPVFHAGLPWNDRALANANLH